MTAQYVTYRMRDALGLRRRNPASRKHDAIGKFLHQTFLGCIHDAATSLSFDAPLINSAGNEASLAETSSTRAEGPRVVKRQSTSH
jgi:hypothetical protein